MLKNDKVRLRHMLDAAREAIEFTSDSSRDDSNYNCKKITMVL